MNRLEYKIIDSHIEDCKELIISLSLSSEFLSTYYNYKVYKINKDTCKIVRSGKSFVGDPLFRILFSKDFRESGLIDNRFRIDCNQLDCACGYKYTTVLRVSISKLHLINNYIKNITDILASLSENMIENKKNML